MTFFRIPVRKTSGENSHWNEENTVKMIQINGLVKSYFFIDWKELWHKERLNKLTLTRQTRMFFPYPRPRFAFQLINQKRDIYSMLVQLITGHNYAKRHQFLINTKKGLLDPDLDINQSMCSLCGEAQETSFHILAECSRLMPLRLQIFGTHTLTPPFVSLKSHQLVAFLRGAPADALKFFVDENHLVPSRTAVRDKTP